MLLFHIRAVDTLYSRPLSESTVCAVTTRNTMKEGSEDILDCKALRAGYYYITYNSIHLTGTDC